MAKLEKLTLSGTLAHEQQQRCSGKLLTAALQGLAKQVSSSGFKHSQVASAKKYSPEVTEGASFFYTNKLLVRKAKRLLAVRP